jgi:aspartate kinase
MALIVQKFGGTSVASTDRIKNVAKRVARWQAQGHDVIVVPSAMAGETNRLIALANEISPSPDPRELDVIASTGEQVTIALLAMAMHAQGLKAKSFTGSQVTVLTDSSFTKARILKIDETRIRKALSDGNVVVVAGFQGADEHGNITTLGRGGSDTSAVALAAALKADECQIYTDVDGVYTTDPRVEPEARKLDTITFEEMLEMASLGSKVLQIRSVEFAGKYKVKLRVLSSFEDEGEGTLITVEEKSTMEQPVISGIAFNRDEAKLTMLGVPDRPGIAYQILGPIADANIDVDMIIQNIGRDDTTDFSFTVNRSDYNKALADPGDRAAEDRRPRPQRRHQHLQSLCRRRRNALASRRRQQDVRRAGQGRDQPANDLDFGDQDLGRHRGKVSGAGRSCPAQSLRPGETGEVEVEFDRP